ncbi:MAG: hypothetical protein M1819_005832 [Sarea resinae]|nr:MAG: hypothetical protein M1819_005832 [Sarea resinae]
MSSPPPTPPPTLPSSRKEWRFIVTGTACEWAEMYRPGRYHPIHFGDTFKAGQYRVIRKLGDGSFSTVWLAVDSQNSRYVALKVMMAKSSAAATTELSMYDVLAHQAPHDSFSKHILMPLDTFEHIGPNGTHRCIVFEPMASTVNSMVEELACHKNDRYNRQYPKLMAKKILKHALSGLAFLHKNNVTHGDFQPGNLLSSTNPSFQSVDEKALRQEDPKTIDHIHRRDGKEDKWGPRYLAVDQKLHDYAELGPNLFIKISDLGAAFWSDKPPKSTVTPLGLRAPELIFDETPSGPSIDIWSFGCLIYEFLVGQPLFMVWCMGDDEKDEADDGHLQDLNDILEPLPDAWMSKWPRSHHYFGPNRERIIPPLPLNPKVDENVVKRDEKDGDTVPDSDMSDVDSVGSGADTEEGKEEGGDENDTGEDKDDDFKPKWVNDSLEVLFEQNKPDDIDTEEAKVITELIRSILQFEPSQRPSAEELLQHPWFNK